LSYIQLRVHHSDKETSCADWNGWGNAIYRRIHIDLNPKLNDECFERTRGVEERNMTDVDEEEFEEEQDLRLRTTSSGRILKLPNRCY